MNVQFRLGNLLQNVPYVRQCTVPHAGWYYRLAYFSPTPGRSAGLML